MGSSVSISGPVILKSLATRSPSKHCYQSYRDYISSPENSIVLHQQLNHLLDWNERNLEDLNPNRGRSLYKETVQMIFRMAAKLKVPDLVKLHAVEIYDRWVLAFQSEIKSMKSFFSDTEVKLIEEKFRDGLAVHVAVCFQLASKTVSCGPNANLLTESLKDVLASMDKTYVLSEINSSEMRVLSALNFNLNCLTPLEIMETVLLHLELDEDNYHLLYGITIRLIDYIYLTTDEIYTVAKDHCNARRKLPMNPDEELMFENDYTLRATAAIQCATFIAYPHGSRLCPDVFSGLTGKGREDIYHVAISFATFVVDNFGSTN